MLKISLFGTGQADFMDQSIADFPNQQSYHLFCYLLLHKNYPHHREHISTIFWGDASTSTSRKRLRNAIWRLRKLCEPFGICIEDYLLIADDTISFINSSNYWLDVEIFEKESEACRDISGRKLTPEQAEKLEMAVTLYKGDLLESSYDDWLLYDRERYRIIYLNLLNKLMVYHGLNGNYERGLGYGNEILSKDSTRERVHRQMMWLYSLADNRNAALLQYKKCCQILQDELGVRPMQETQNLYAALIRNEFNPDTWPVDQIRTSHSIGMTDRSISSLVRKALQKLNRLQETIEGTSEELHIIEQMINEALTQTMGQPNNTPE
jgi:DNA-binding SARP family transcriptional activator